MSMPTISDINPNISINRDDALNVIIASIAMEELALAHILNAEGEKLQYVLGTLEGKDPGDVTICDIMEVNNSVRKTLRDVIKSEMILQFKLEDVLELAENGGESECQLTIKGQKTWRDGNNIAQTRPPEVQINLLRDGAIYKSVTIDSTGSGDYTFSCLPLYRDSQNEYTYEIDEEDVAGYDKTVSGYNITNTVQPGSIPIEGTIIWDDRDNEDGLRPASIIVYLLRNSVQLDEQTVTIEPDATDPVPFSFGNVERFDENGIPYIYTVDEDTAAELAGYEKTVDGYNITNTLP